MKKIKEGTVFFYAGKTEVINGSGMSFDGLWTSGKGETIANIKMAIGRSKENQFDKKITLVAFNQV